MNLNFLQGISGLPSHPQSRELLRVLSGETGVSSSGFPYISNEAFTHFREHVAHLYQDGLQVLRFLNSVEGKLSSMDVPFDERDSIQRAIKVIRTIVFTAGVTATPDLWLLRQVLSTHKQLGILDHLLKGDEVDISMYAEQNKLNAEQLKTDLHFLYSRGYIEESSNGFVIKNSPLVLEVFQQIQKIPEEFKINMVQKIAGWFCGESLEKKLVSSYLEMHTQLQPGKEWTAGIGQLELGYRLMPLVLGMRVAGLSSCLRNNADIVQQVPLVLPEMLKLFEGAGMVEEGKVTELGARVFERGPGPFGSIAAYHPYMSQHNELLKQGSAKVWVRRGANVAASQDANAKTFKVSNDSLDRFRKDHGFEFGIFIEHAVGQGEATRQRFLLDGEQSIQYIGADLEDAAIDKAIEQQEMGLLPVNMQFIRGADIGKPEKVIDFLKQNQLTHQPAVMVVGNGFHEIRQQTNDKMVEVFQKYQEAGLVLVFTEESALNDQDLLNTAWNTYHAGFRYVHQMSGQGLRPAIDRGHQSSLWSWRKCITKGGYHLLEEYSHRTRSIYPFKSNREENPSISVTYFCVPKQWVEKLNIGRD